MILISVITSIDERMATPDKRMPLSITNKAIAKNKYTQMAQDFCSSATTAWMQEVEQRMEQLPRRKNG
ncbi:MAG: hypothetical protein EPN17_13440, partial [Methylobacter sp.]